MSHYVRSLAPNTSSLASDSDFCSSLTLAVDQNMTENATQQDISRLIQSLKLRDERIVTVETELRQVADDYRRLREELLPVFKMTKDRLQPLPPPEGHIYDGQALTSPSQLNLADRNPSSISRSIPKRIYTGSSTPKTNSPTHIPSAYHDGRGYNDTGASLDPSSGTHISNGISQQSSPAIPSPTSPGGHHQHQTLGPRAYRPMSRNTHDHSDDGPTSQSSRGGGDTGPGGQQPSVEIFKSFRVSLEDPCHKVLPAALKKYNINGDWRQYALYIVYGDQERCLMLDERPLILFKQLEKEGRKPMFMLRKHTYSNIGLTPSSIEATRLGQGQINLPGGVL